MIPHNTRGDLEGLGSFLNATVEMENINQEEKKTYKYNNTKETHPLPKQSRYTDFRINFLAESSQLSSTAEGWRAQLMKQRITTRKR